MSKIKTYYSENLKANVTVPEDEPRREWRETRKGWELVEETADGSLERIGHVSTYRHNLQHDVWCYRWQTDSKIGWGVPYLRDAKLMVEENINAL